MTHIFVYGSLMFDPIWEKTVTGRYISQQGVITGWRRLKVKKALYPGLIEDDGTVDGIVRFDVLRKDINRLDAFEGDYYQRKICTVRLPGEQTIKADVYVFKKEYRHLLEDKNWDSGRFAQNGLSRFMHEYRGFDTI